MMAVIYPLLGTFHSCIGWHTPTCVHTQTGGKKWRIETRANPSHMKALLIHTWCAVVTLALFSILFPASIVTVIRLVNDAVDDIESEGMSAFLFMLLCLPLGAFGGVRLGHGVCSWGFLCFSAFRLCFSFLSDSSSDYHSLASFVVSNMDKEQRRNSPGEWIAA